MEVEQAAYVRGAFENTFTSGENGTPLAIKNDMWR